MGVLMSLFRFHERPRSGAGGRESRTLEYVAAGESDRFTVRAYAQAATPAIIVTNEGLMHRQDIQLDPQGRDIFYITVPYAKKKKDSYTLSFDTMGGTVRIKASRGTIAKYPSTATDHKGMIGVKPDGEVEGLDIVIPALKISVEATHPAGTISLAQIKLLAQTTACVNSDVFLTFAPGEVLFLGCSGREGTDIETTVSYHFACSQNASGLSIGDIAGIVKDGHDAAWISYKAAEDSGKPATQPLAVYVERVYQRVALSTILGFGS
jgi:hypothetical protein